MELSLDLCLAYAPKTVSGSDKMMKLEDFVTKLEDESRKIEAFKRELPLCMLLLNDAIQRLKKEAVLCADSRDRASMENFLPLKLWGPTETSVPELNLRSEEESRSEKIEFVPSQVVSGLCLATPVPESATCNDKSMIAGGSDSPEKLRREQGMRKQRRCWSPELHRRFLDSLRRLGGPKVATPKQIRELMQVDGLTNDEVKSHLQKYRLHVRKLPSSLQNVSWVDKDRLGDPSETNNSPSGSPQGPLCRGKGVSSNGEDSIEIEEDDKTECHSWRGGMVDEVVV